MREFLVFALLCITCALFIQPLGNDDLPVLAAVYGITWALCVAVLARRGFYRPSTAYIILFGLFHGGLLISIALGGPDVLPGYDSSWLSGGYTAGAVRLTITGMVACTLAATVAAGSAPTRPPVAVSPLAGGISAATGLSVELAGLGIFASAVAQAGGLGLLSGGYTEFLQANESDGSLGYGTLLIGVGTILAIIAGGPARVAGWIGFSCYAAVAFLIGTRGAVLFPLLALLVVEHRRGRRIRPQWTLIGVPCLLALIGLVRATRLPGGDTRISSLWSAPLEAVAEMGCALRPVTVVLDWHSWGDSFLHGMTLVAVPMRFIEGVTGWHGGPPSTDDRLLNVEITDRVGPIGASPIAEGYHNAGLLGVVALLAVIGLVLGGLERRPRTPLADARVGIVLLPLLIQTRNSFAPVPVQLGIGLLLLWLVWAVSRAVSARVGRR
ncbi:O-antigen polysaccharide polymerase Wzy [Amycolatopsis pithecellobii]|uniref:O-antigen polysaccharide polymerase Wzy n=1 Tax=Amycolatopsis pithecellobii TaxID=664692 RepID=A0A6N7Z8J3_9PSEU|nr:O-antigen polysaccharide polymerase Wzy [Amycolatopsis pithecellobii]MTD58031.1 O-antigen polysaccharide polymerase Wzy [Amycolatopsis pithecellobii]